MIIRDWPFNFTGWLYGDVKQKNPSISIKIEVRECIWGVLWENEANNMLGVMTSFDLMSVES